MKKTKSIVSAIILTSISAFLIILAFNLGGTSNLFVPKSSGLGVTLDFSNPWSYAFLAGIVLIVVAAIIVKNLLKKK